MRKGEILGLFGLLGAGCNEAALAIFGAWEGHVGGRVFVDGREVVIRQPPSRTASAWWRRTGGRAWSTSTPSPRTS